MFSSSLLWKLAVNTIILDEKAYLKRSVRSEGVLPPACPRIVREVCHSDLSTADFQGAERFPAALPK